MEKKVVDPSRKRRDFLVSSTLPFSSKPFPDQEVGGGMAGTLLDGEGSIWHVNSGTGKFQNSRVSNSFQTAGQKEFMMPAKDR